MSPFGQLAQIKSLTTIETFSKFFLPTILLVVLRNTLLTAVLELETRITQQLIKTWYG